MASKKYDIDTYLNPYLPRPRLDILPGGISHFLGYRPASKPPTTITTRRLLAIWASHLIGAFCGVALIEAVFMHLPALGGHSVPMIIASFGASAILSYNAIEAPLAQPRSLIFGQLISSIIGVCITKLFELLPAGRFKELQWLAGAVAVGTASLAMTLTKSVHPPAGATALIMATSDDVRALGWWAIAIVLLGSLLMLTSALLINNVARRYPMYWWTPVDLSQLQQQKKAKSDVEKGDQQPRTASKSKSISESSSVSTELTREEARHTLPERPAATRRAVELVVSGEGVTLPEGLELDESEKKLLAVIQGKIRGATSTRQ